jgi:hypothetical protein
VSVEGVGIRGPFWTMQATGHGVEGVDAAWGLVTVAADDVVCVSLIPTMLDGGGWRVKVFLAGGVAFTDRALYTEDQAREIRDEWIKSRVADAPEPPGPVGCAPDCPACARERAAQRDVRDVVVPGDIAETAPTRDAGLRNPIVDAPLPLEQALRNVLESHHADVGSSTPDFVLAEFLGRVLQAFDRAVRARNAYWDHAKRPTAPPPIHPGRLMPTVSAEVYDAVAELLGYTGQTGANGPTFGGTQAPIARLRSAFEAYEKWRSGGPDGV